MKKNIIIAMIAIIIATMLLLTACGKESNPEAKNNPAMKVVGYTCDFHTTIYYICDNMTKNMYFQYGSEGGLSPLYNQDGTIMSYDTWLKSTKEYNTNIY